MLSRKIRYCSLPEAVREHFLWGARSIVIAGTHGKTTTTSLTGWVLASAGNDPTVLVGGIARNFGEAGSSYRVGQGRDFVIEGDEYDSAFFDKTAKFLKYLPDIAVVNNIEFDHADIYADLDAVMLAFKRLTLLVPKTGLLLLGADSPHAASLKSMAVSPVQTFGFDETADWVAYDLHAADGIQTFSVRHGQEYFGSFRLPLFGRHNVRNALAAIAVGSAVGLDHTTIGDGLKSFLGVKRRLEIVGEAGGVTVYDDFAHHPTAVAETLRAVREAYPGRRVLGGLRATLSLVLPSRVPEGLRRRVLDARRRRDDRRGRVPLDAAARPAALGRGPRGGRQRGRPSSASRRGRRHDRRHDRPRTAAR